ncbi:exodeoxyribonuclease III [Candidatus Photodesmus anomalopis]|uniref:Exodeoxyribonuclease III n=1 Tax=Candidatus Photodesmus katoptron Akat1 TaxID=1236703 RepID=S3DG96_9GAMM|nr:exodeoxyribonuclease III [Candidatus Photodesmus katoptron]EPE37452.1 exodeoxyribonuclease III [Candidatus Photodesmus katoptron Akat1]
MKIVSFNINGLRARFHELQAIIDKHQPDIIGLQEIKVDNQAFPKNDIESMGYTVCFHGQKGHYGVATLSKSQPISVRKGFPTDSKEHQKRMIIATFKNSKNREITILNGYFPQGDNIANIIKYSYKRKFFEDLMSYLNVYHNNEESLIILGDINISYMDVDIGIGEKNRKRWLKTGKCSFQPEEREWFKTVLNWGFEDTFRKLYPEETGKYSWFDYRSHGFDENRGLRIDAILATSSLAIKCIDSGIDYEIRGINKPSDHAPIWSTFQLENLT